METLRVLFKVTFWSRGKEPKEKGGWRHEVGISQSVVLRPPGSESSVASVQLQTPGSHPRSTRSESKHGSQESTFLLSTKMFSTHAEFWEPLQEIRLRLWNWAKNLCYWSWFLCQRKEPWAECSLAYLCYTHSSLSFVYLCTQLQLQMRNPTLQIVLGPKEANRYSWPPWELSSKNIAFIGFLL